ncbi:MAG: YtxH domain-containing protein [Nitrospiraceae bacterium]
MESADTHESGTLSAFLAGALIGAGIGLLFAPQSGSQMRGLIRDYATRAKDGLDEAITHGADVWDSARDRGEDLIEKGKESLREAGSQVKSFTEAGEKSATGTRDGLASRHS